MKVISSPDLSTWKYQCTCGICTSKLEANADDLLYKMDKQWYSDSMGDGGYYADVEIFYVNCPVCDKTVNVHPGDIPYLLKEKTKQKMKKVKK